MYPRLNLSIVAQPLASRVFGVVPLLNNYLLSHMREVAGYLASRGDRTFSGFIVGSARPYHFFYDQLAVLAHVARDIGPSAARLPVILLEQCAFLSIQELLPEGIDERRVPDAETLRDANVSDAKFSVLIGANNGMVGARRQTLACLADIRKCVAGAATGSAKLARAMTAIRARSPVVWVGVTSQKRRWLDQEDAPG